MRGVHSPYGALIRLRRLEHGRTLRDVASAVGISHQYLADVEIGVAGPLRKSFERALLRCLPTVSKRELDHARDLSKPVLITLKNTPKQYIEVTRAIARRYARRDLSREQVEELLRILHQSHRRSGR